MTTGQFAAYLQDLSPDEMAKAAILESWQRCAAARLSRNGPVRLHRVGDIELAERLRGSSALVAAARAELEALVRELPGSTNAAYVTDRDGIVLGSVGPAAELERFGLLPGFDWSEARMGTNGAGTCLATRRPIVIAGPHHYLTAFEDCTCTAAPVRGPDRRILGAIDVSSSVADAPPHRIERVVAAAERIEARLAGLG